MNQLEHHSFGPYGQPHQSIYLESATQEYPLGTRYAEPGPLGRVFRYAKAGAAITPGKMLATAQYGGAAGTAEQTQCAVAVAASTNDKRIYITASSSAQVLDLFAGGMAIIMDVSATPDDFYSIPIESHSALLSTGTASYIDLQYGAPVALTTSDKVDLFVNPWKDIIIQPTTTHTGSPIGVAQVNVTSAYYFWCQTWGPVGIMSNAGPLTVGASVISSTDIAGGIASGNVASSTYPQPQVGLCLTIGTDVFGAGVYLMIAP